MSYKIEFIEGEPVCRINGNLATDEWLINEVGTAEDDIVITDDYILTSYALYYDNSISLDILLKAVGQWHEPAEVYDNILSRGLGQARQWVEERLLGKNGAWVIQGNDWVGEFHLIPDKDKFYRENPKFNKRKYFALQKALNDYYENRP